MRRHTRGMLSAPALAALLAGLLSGCSLLFGEVAKTECRGHVDCPEQEVCSADRVCEPGIRPIDTLDEGLPDQDVGPVDAGLDRGPTVDARPDRALDAEPDLAPDADPSVLAFGPSGDCFDGSLQGTFDPESPAVGERHVPLAACSPFARLWTAGGPDGVELAWDLDGDAVAEGRMALGGRYAVGEGAVFAPGPRDADGRRSMTRVDLRSGAALAVRLGTFDHRDPVFHQQRLAFVETVRDGTPGVVIVDRAAGDDRAEWECVRDGAAQWGPALGPGFAAWFEQPLGSRLTRIVVLDGPVCTMETSRRERLLGAVVPAESRLWVVDGGLVWLEPRADTRGNRIRRWRFDDPGADVETLYLEGETLRVDPVRPPEDGANPVELAAHGARLAVISYDFDGSRRYVLDTVNFAAPRERAVTRAGQGDDARLPWLSASYLLWAEADRLGIWRVAYEQLD